MSVVSARSLGRNAITATTEQVWRIASRLVLTPVILSNVGLEGYGVWAIIFSLASYVAVTKAGFGIAYMKYTAECISRGEHARLTQIVSSGVMGTASVAIMALLGTWLAGPHILSGLQVSAALLPDASIALFIVMACLVLRMSLGYAMDVLCGMQRMDIAIRLNVLSSILDFGVALPLLLCGKGLVGLAIGHVVGQSVTLFMAVLLVRSRMPQLKVSPRYASRRGILEILSLGGRFQLLSLINTLVEHGLKFFVSGTLGPIWTGTYEIALRVLGLGQALCSSFLSPLMPAFASLQAGDERTRESTLLTTGTKVLAVSATMSMGFISAMSGDLILLWLGRAVPEAELALLMLAPGYVIMLMTGVISANLRARGIVGLELRYGLASTTLLIVLGMSLWRQHGFNGLVLAQSLSLILSSLWYFRAYFRISTGSLRKLMMEARFARAVIIVLIGSAAILSLRSPLVSWDAVGHGRMAALSRVLVLGCAYSAIVLSLNWHFVLSTGERVQFRTLAAGLVPRRR